MVEKEIEAKLFSNKIIKGVMPIDLNDGIYNISFVEVDGSRHYLKAQDMNGDQVFTSDPENNKKIDDFLNCKPESNADSSVIGLSERFLLKFISVQGKIFASEYKEQNSFMLKFEYSDRKLLYACAIDRKETTSVEKRDKIHTKEIMPDVNQIKSSTQICDTKVVDINSFVNEQGDSKEDVIKKITASIKDYEFVKAEDLISVYGDKINDDLIVLGLKAEIYNHQRRTKDCLTVCDQILGKDCDNAKAKSEKALALRALRKFDEALDLIDQAILKEPLVERHYFIKAFNLNCKGLDYNKQALLVINKALELNPNYSCGLSIKALIYSEMKDYDRALVLFDKAIMLEPKNSFAYNHKGLYYDGLEKYDKSKECFLNAIKVDPNFSVAHDNLGEVYQRVGNHEEARKCFEAAVQCSPENTHAVTNLAKSYWRDNKLEEAHKWIDKAIENEPDYPWALDLKGTLLYQSKKYEESVPFFERAVKIKGNNPDFLSNLGWAYIYVNKRSEAFDIFQDALDYDPENYSAITGKDKILRE